MSPPTTAIYVTYNSRCCISDCLASAQLSFEQGLLTCVVVDNASSDETVDLVRSEFPWVTVIASRTNLGYGRALNLGIRHATTPYVLFGNPDVVLPADSLRRLLEFIGANAGVGMVAPAIREGDALQHAGGLPTPWTIVTSAFGWRDASASRREIVPGSPPFETDWLCGALLLARRQLLEDLGGFDSRFFLYFEETDLCTRIRQCGFGLWAVGEAVAQHSGGASARQTGHRLAMGCIADHYFRSRLYYLVKHFGAPAAIMAEVVELVGLAAGGVRRVMCGKRPDRLIERLKGPVLKLPSRTSTFHHEHPGC